MKDPLTFVIPTGVRPSVPGWSNAVEEPAVSTVFQLLPFCLIVVLLSSLSAAQELPRGWRRPTNAEASDDWRSKSRTRFLIASGDFDGDGNADFAELLVNPSHKKWALFVKLQSAGQWQRVGDENGMDWLPSMGIHLVKPGKYETACGKGYGEEFCAQGEPKYLKLSTDAIDLFKEESADSVVYWDQKSHKFRFIQMSD